MNRGMHKGGMLRTNKLMLLFTLCVVSFFICFSLNIRPCSDDLWFYQSFKEKGFVDFFKDYEYNKRFFSQSVFGFMVIISTDYFQFVILLKWLYILLFSLLYLSIFLNLRLWTQRLGINEKSKSPYLFFTTLVFLLLFFGTTNAIEVWFWPISSLIYLNALILFLLGCYFLVKNESNQRLEYNSILCFFLLGGTSENFAICVMCLLCYGLYAKREQSKWILFKGAPAMFSLAILPVMSLLGNGVNKRIEGNYNSESTGYFLNEQIGYFPPIKTGIMIALVGLTFLAVNYFFKRHKPTKIKWNGINLLGCTIAVLGGALIPLIVVFGNLGPSRAWFPINILVVSLILILSVKIAHTSFIDRFKPAVFRFSLILSTIILSGYFYHQYSVTSKYAKGYDQFVQDVSKSKSDTLYVNKSPFKEPGFFPAAELSYQDEKPISITSYYMGKVVDGPDIVLLKEQ